MPFDYSLLFLRINIDKNPLPIIFSFLSIIIYAWSFLNLTSKKVIDGLTKKGHEFKKPWKKIYAGMILGAIFSIITMTMMIPLLGGEKTPISP